MVGWIYSGRLIYSGKLVVQRYVGYTVNAHRHQNRNVPTTFQALCNSHLQKRSLFKLKYYHPGSAHNGNIPKVESCFLCHNTPTHLPDKLPSFFDKFQEPLIVYSGDVSLEFAIREGWSQPPRCYKTEQRRLKMEVDRRATNNGFSKFRR